MFNLLKLPSTRFVHGDPANDAPFGQKRAVCVRLPPFSTLHHLAARAAPCRAVPWWAEWQLLYLVSVPQRKLTIFCKLQGYSLHCIAFLVNATRRKDQKKKKRYETQFRLLLQALRVYLRQCYLFVLCWLIWLPLCKFSMLCKCGTHVSCPRSSVWPLRNINSCEVNSTFSKPA